MMRDTEFMQPLDSDLAVKVDQYIEDLFCPPDAVLDACLRDAAAAGLPPIQVSPVMGRTLELIAKILSPTRILEIGTLAGYSTLWLARGLAPGGTITTIEMNPAHADVARRNLERAGLKAPQLELLIGDAAELLPALNGHAKFDLIFIDADKTAYPRYLELIENLWRPGTIVIADNVIRHGRVIDENPPDVWDHGAAEFNRLLAAHPALESIVIPSVRHVIDGFSVSRVK